ncbi:hypothetical protein [Streptomyces tubercidicus]
MTEPEDTRDTRRTRLWWGELPWWGEMLRGLTLGLLTVGTTWTLKRVQPPPWPLDENVMFVMWIVTAVGGGVLAVAAFATGAFELAQRCVRRKG